MADTGRRVLLPHTAVDPRCTGLCKGERGAADAPSLPGHTPDGRKVLFCPCCSHIMRRVHIDEPGVPPNMNPDARAIPIRFADDICGYETVVLLKLH